MLSQCELGVRLGHVITDPIKLHRGPPQGALESPPVVHLRVWTGASVHCCSDGKLKEKVGSSVNIGLRSWDTLMTLWFSAKTKTTWRRC